VVCMHSDISLNVCRRTLNTLQQLFVELSSNYVELCRGSRTAILKLCMLGMSKHSNTGF